MTVTGPLQLPAPVQLWFDEALLAVPTPFYIHRYPAMWKSIPARSGTKIRMRRYNRLPSATVPLGPNSLTPPPVVLTAVDIDATMQFYGQWIALNEQIVLQNQDPVLNEAAARLGESLRQTEDEITRNVLASTASIINCVNGTNGDNPTNSSTTDVFDVVTALRNADGYPIQGAIEGEDRFGTGPVRDCYIVMANTALINDLNNLSGWLPKWQYPAADTSLTSEEGALGQTRWLLSTLGSVSENASALGADVYNCFAVAKEGYAIVNQDDYRPSFLYRDPMYSGPLSLYGTVGWKTAMVARITQDTWVNNLRCTLS